MPTIGIGITTHNRYPTFRKTYNQIRMFMPPDTKLVVVDDGSLNPVQEATSRFDKNKGIAVAKNKCFELLEDCEYLFLFDDDFYPIAKNWHIPYIESGEHHLMYIFKDFANGQKINDTEIIYSDDNITAYTHPRGCMLYYTNHCIKEAGGMNPIFGAWGFEHGLLSDVIYNRGLTRFRYADVTNSDRFFYSSDEHRKIASTVIGDKRKQCIARNRPIYERLKNTITFTPYK